MADFDAGRLREAANAALKDLHPAGFGLGVVSGGVLVFSEGFGLADIETGKPQDPNLRQRIGSITKTMVGLCAMALVDEGRLTLADRLVDHIPEVAIDGEAEAVTIRHLLTHTSGIGEVPTAKDVKTTQDTLWSAGPDSDVLGLFPDGLTLDVTPGTKWSYANLGYALLGEIVSRIEGAPIAEVVERRVFRPLGMAGSDLLDRPHRDLSTPYHHPLTEEAKAFNREKGIPFDEDETPVDGHNIRGEFKYIRGGGAAGAVQSTIPDMARYAAALLRQGGGIVRPETFAAMIAPQWAPDERLESWGLSFQRFRHFGVPIFGHGGGVVGGWNTMLLIIPSRDMALLVHSNTAFQDFDKLVSRLLAATLGVAAERASGTVSPEILAAAPGVYESPGGVLTNFRIIGAMGRLQIKAENGGLKLHSRRGNWKGGVTMIPADPADPGFFALDDDPLQPSHLALVRDAAGAVIGLRCDRLVEMVRTETVEPWA
ncbi:MAG TPA: serine hydrolase domain-containing protein [Caulobacteraceae bacterium]|nr:serine hydrolase domain-containing protein [Caulobacteraceae bacterium]